MLATKNSLEMVQYTKCTCSNETHPTTLGCIHLKRKFEKQIVLWRFSISIDFSNTFSPIPKLKLKVKVSESGGVNIPKLYEVKKERNDLVLTVGYIQWKEN